MVTRRKKKHSSQAVKQTHDDDGAGDGDGGQRDVGDGVRFDGVLDALVVAVNAALVGLVHDVHDHEGKRSCTEKKERRVDEIGPRGSPRRAQWGTGSD